MDSNALLFIFGLIHWLVRLTIIVLLLSLVHPRSCPAPNQLGSSIPTIVLHHEGFVDDEDYEYYSASEDLEDEGSMTFIHSLLIPDLPDDVVIGHIWPLLLHRVLANDICNYRAISIRWRDLVGTSLHWRLLHPLLELGHPQPSFAALGWTIDDCLYVAMEGHLAQIELEALGPELA